jgi:hypothetical protein
VRQTLRNSDEETRQDMGRIFKQMTKFFAVFLAALATLYAVRYPIVPERLLAVYQVDLGTATALTSGLTLVGLAGCIFLVASHVYSPHFAHDGLASAKRLAWAGALLLAACAAGLLGNAALVRVSTEIARATNPAEEREAFDRLARDRLVEFRDDSISVWKKYRLAAEFLEIERLDGQTSEEVLNSAERAPLQNEILSTYVGTICCFKLGLFMTASALYARSQKSSRKRRLVG